MIPIWVGPLSRLLIIVRSSLKSSHGYLLPSLDELPPADPYTNLLNSIPARNQQTLVCSIEAVRDELLEGDDELANWAHANKAFFRAIDQGTTRHFTDLTCWATSQYFTPAALSEFTGNKADYLLVAYAREHQHTVVTHERSQPNAHARVLIPGACSAMSTSTTDTFQMLRQTGAQLDLRGTSSTL